VVNPYKVDSWPIEPNSRGAKASGELCMPPIRDAPEEEEDVPESDCESEDDGFPRALPGLRYGQSPHVVRYDEDEDEDEDEDDGDDDESKASGEDEEDIAAGTAADSAADTPATPVRYGAAPPLGAPPPSAGGGAASPPAAPESSPGGADPPPAAPAPVEARSPSPDVGMAKAPPKRLPPLDLGKM